MAKKRRNALHLIDARDRQLLLEIGILRNAANTLIVESCSATAVAQALHPVRWLKEHLKPRTRDPFRPVLLVKESPRLLAATKHLVTVAKKYLIDVPKPKYWSHDDMTAKQGTDYAKRETARRDKVYEKIAHDAKKYYVRRKMQRASAPELLALNVFASALQDIRSSYQAPRPAEHSAPSFRSIEVGCSHCPHCDGHYGDR